MIKKTGLFFVFLLFTGSVYSISVMEGVNKYELDNGFKVLIKEVHNAPLVYVGMWYKVGRRNETNGIVGTAHFLEHMLFRSTKKYRGGDLTKLLTETGALANGWTAYNTTAYWEVLSPSKLDLALDIEKERMKNALIDEEEFRKERMVVLSELRNNRNSPDSLLNERLFSEAFDGLPMGRQESLKEIEDVSGLTFDDMKKFYNKFYAPNNVFLIIVGDIKTQDVLAKIRNVFGGLQKKNIAEEKVLRAAHRSTNIVIVQGVAPDPFGSVIYYAPPASIKNVDSVVLSFISSIDLLREVGYYETPDDTVMWSDFGGDKPYYIDETIDENYIKKALPRLTKKFFAQEKTSYSRLSDIGNIIGAFERKGDYKTYDALMDDFKKITPDEVISIIHKYLNRTNAVTGILEVSSVKAGIESQPVLPRNDAAVRTEPVSVNNEGSQEELKKYQKEVENMLFDVKAAADRFSGDVLDRTLDNGLRIIIKENHQNEQLSIRLGIHAGIGFEKPGQPDLSGLTASLVFDGGPFIKLKNDLDAEGAQGSWGNSLDYATFSVNGMPEHLSRIIEWVSLSLKDRKFMPLVLEMEKNDLKRDVIHSDYVDDPDYHAEKNLNKLLYPPLHPIREREDAVESDYDKIMMPAVQEFYDKYYQANGSVLIIVGNIKKEEAYQQAVKFLSSWKKGSDKVNVVSVPPLTLPDKTIVVKKEMPKKEQSIIRFGAEGLMHDDPLYIPNAVMNSIVGNGGFMNSRLIQAIRVKLGLSYHAEAWFESTLGECPFQGYIQTAPGTVDRAIEIFIDELRKVQKDGVYEKEVLLAKISMLSRFAFMLETINSQANTFENFVLYRQDPDYLNKYLKILSSVTKEEVNECAKKFLHPDRLTISIAGAK